MSPISNINKSKINSLVNRYHEESKKDNKNIDYYSNEDKQSQTEIDKQKYGELFQKEERNSTADNKVNNDLDTKISTNLADKNKTNISEDKQTVVGITNNVDNSIDQHQYLKQDNNEKDDAINNDRKLIIQ